MFDIYVQVQSVRVCARLPHISWQTGVDAMASVIIHMGKYCGAHSKADRSVSPQWQSVAVCSQAAQSCTAWLNACAGNSGLSTTVYKLKRRNQRKRGKSHLCLFHYALCIRSRQERLWEGRRGGMQYRNKYACVCMYCWVGEADSLPLGELIQRICSASREGERGLIGTVCATHLCWNTQVRTLSAIPTAECMSSIAVKSEL